MSTTGLSLKVSEEVRDALASGYPVVALESTVIAHGLPRPRNLEAARVLEDTARAGGAVPATIAVIDGTAHIGLGQADLERLATQDGIEKLSTRELPVAIARGSTGATTVAATSFLAHRAGIHVFATGGIGGVHRGELPDISPDLDQLARARIVVVCAGAKSILDLPATREVLESRGVLVLGWRTSEFPTFYSRESSLQVDARVDDAEEVAAIWRAGDAAGIGSSILLCAPIPVEAALPAERIDTAIADALAGAERDNIHGKAITPYLLRTLAEATRGESIAANLALLRNNVAVAAAVAGRIAAR